MRELPLLVSGPLVRAILDGRKTVTRRLPRNPGGWLLHPRGPTMLSCYQPSAPHDYAERDIDAPYAVGDVLWVRETWAYTGGDEYLYQCDPAAVAYRATFRPTLAQGLDYAPGGKWRPSIHMPRWAARIFLRVESVTVERVQEITEEDAIREGCDWAAPHWPNPRDVPERDEPNCGPPPVRGERGFARDNFRRLWDSLAPAGSKWADDPWVWVVGFRRVAGVERA